MWLCGVSCNEAVDVTAANVVLFGVIKSIGAKDRNFLAISSVCPVCSEEQMNKYSNKVLQV
jgi:formate dehydrogenase assembly factor FdhD